MIATTTTKNTEKMGRTARQMAEVQRESYEAFTENLAAAQRRSIELANGGLSSSGCRRTTPGPPRSGSWAA